MKWINLWIKNSEDYNYTKTAFNSVPQQLFCTKAKKYCGVKVRNIIFKCLCTHLGSVAS